MTVMKTAVDFIKACSCQQHCRHAVRAVLGLGSAKSAHTVPTQNLLVCKLHAMMSIWDQAPQEAATGTLRQRLSHCQGCVRPATHALKQYKAHKQAETAWHPLQLCLFMMLPTCSVTVACAADSRIADACMYPPNCHCS